MAAPPSADIRNMTGTWVLNRSLSDSFDPTFAAQGVPWALRKILGFAGVSLHMTQTSSPPQQDPDGEPVVSIHVTQTVTPGGFNSEEPYILDFRPRESTVPIFGTLSVRARYLSLGEVEDDELRKRLAIDGADVVIQELAENAKSGWSTAGIWGFENIDQTRHFTRTNVTARGDTKVVARLVYDFKAET